MGEKRYKEQQHTPKQTLSALDVLQRQLRMLVTPGPSVFTAQRTRLPVNVAGLVIRHVLTKNPGVSRLLLAQLLSLCAYMCEMCENRAVRLV